MYGSGRKVLVNYFSQTERYEVFPGSETQFVGNAVTVKQGNQRKLSRRVYDELEIDGAPAINAVILRRRY